MKKIRLNDKMTLAFIKDRIDPLAVARNGKKKYLASLDNVLKDLFDKKNLGSKIIRCTSYKELYNIISMIDGPALFEILRNNTSYRNLAVLITLDYAIESGKADDKKSKKLRAKSVKAFIDNFDIRRAASGDDYSSLKSFVKKSEKSYDDFDDFDFGDSIFDDEDDFDNGYDTDDDSDAFEEFVSRKSNRKAPKHRAINDDDEDDETEDKLDALINTVSKLTKVMSQQKPEPKSDVGVSALASRISNIATNVDKKFEMQNSINEKVYDMLDDQSDKLDSIMTMIAAATSDDDDDDDDSGYVENRVNPLDDISATSVAEETMPTSGQIYRQQKPNNN